jgi:hypothetical protein
VLLLRKAAAFDAERLYRTPGTLPNFKNFVSYGISLASLRIGTSREEHPRLLFSVSTCQKLTLSSITPVILTVLPWSSCSEGSLASGLPPGTQPVNVWFGYLSPKLMKTFPRLLMKTATTKAKTVTLWLMYFGALL